MNLPRIFRCFITGLALLSSAIANGSPPPLALKTISASQLVAPVAITNAGDGSNRIFVCDQIGQVRIISDEMLLPTPFLDVSAKMVALSTSYDERGLLSMAFHPNFANAGQAGYGKFYVFYSAPSPNALANSKVSAISINSPCTVTTPSPHGLATGAVVQIAGVTGGTFSPAINATYTVTVIDAYNFTVPVNCTSNAGLAVSSANIYVTAPVNCRSTVSEFQVSAGNPNVADPATERVVIAWDKPQMNHNGGQLAFGPDGYLYITVGDGGAQYDNAYGHTGGSSANGTKTSTGNSTGNLGNAQDTTKLLGKILRIDPLGTNGPTGAYGIPSDNPFAMTGGGVRPEIYTFGMRNPWRLSFDNDPVHGWRLIEGDVGQDDVEEINLIINGGNYGWRIMEGTFPHDSSSPSGGGTLINPVAEYAHPATNLTNYPGLTNIGTAVIGGHVYRGSAIPGLAGQYVFADYSAAGTAAGLLLALDASNWALSQPVVTTITKPVTVGTVPFFVLGMGVDEAGELYVGTEVTKGPNRTQPTGTIYKIVAAQTSSVTLAPNHDNTIFSESSALSNALGSIYAGETASGAIRRGLLSFDIAGNVPAGSVITSAQLTLDMTQTSATAAANMSLYRLSQAWGEGTSGPGTGAGAPATVGDATWGDRLYDPTNPTTWLVAGGTHSGTVSATASVGVPPGYYTWSSAQMVSDVQGWLGTPSTNYGWELLGDETTVQTARAFGSRESAANAQPALLVSYASAPALTWRETWLQTNFSPIGTYVADTASPSGGGLNNLLSYALFLSPLVSYPPGAGSQITATSDGVHDTFTITFRRDPRATDLTYQLQTSSDLTNWNIIAQSTGGAVSTGSGFVSENPATGAAPIIIVTAQEVLPSPANRFSRLVVIRAN